MGTIGWIVVVCGSLIALAAVGVMLARVPGRHTPLSKEGRGYLVGSLVFGIGLVAVTVSGGSRCAASVRACSSAAAYCC